MRIEHSIAGLSALYANFKSSKNYHTWDFAEHEEEPELSLDEAMEMWS